MFSTEQKAIKLAERAVERLQTRGRTYMAAEVTNNLVAFYATLGNETKALALASDLFAKGDRSEMLLHNLLTLYLRNDMDREAQQVSDEMTKAGFGGSRLARARVLAGMGDIQGVLGVRGAEMREWGNEYRRDDWMEVVCFAYCAGHQHERALQDLGSPQTPRLLLLRAQVLSNLGRDEDAEVDYLSAEQLEPNSVVTARRFGDFLYHQHKWKDAIERFERAGAENLLNPQFPRLATCLLNADQPDRCISMVRNWLRAGLGFNESIYGVGARAAWRIEDFPFALELLKELIRKGSDKGSVHRKMLAQVYLRLNELQESHHLLLQVISETPEDRRVSPWRWLRGRF